MNIHEALKQLEFRKREYFKWKNNIRYDQRLEKKSEDDFLRYVGRKTMNPFIAWERTSEYKQLLAIYMNTKIANDYQDIYESVAEKAKTGDPSAVKVFLQLSKEIAKDSKIAEKLFEGEEETEIENDDLEL